MTRPIATIAVGKRMAKDLAIAIAGSIGVVAVLMYLEAFEALREFSRTHEDWELDALILAVATTALWSAWFAWRQWQNAKRQVRHLEAAERALKKSHEEFGFLVDAAPGVFYVREAGPNGDMVYVSQKMKHLFGYTPEVMQGKSAFGPEYIHPEDRTEFEAGRATLLGEGRITGQYRLRCADGRYCWVENHAVVLRDNKGEPEGIVGYIGDISMHKAFAAQLSSAVAARTSELSAVNRALEEEVAERQAIAATLQQEQDRSARLIAQLPGFVYVRDCQDGGCDRDCQGRASVRFISNGVRRILGYAPAELVGENAIDLSDLIHPDDRDIVRLSREIGFQDRETSDCEFRVRRADGEERWVWERLRGVYSSDGELQRCEGYVEDITERKRIDEALRQSRDRLDIVTNNLPFAVSYVASDERLLSANKTFCEWFGKSLEEITSKPLTEIVTPSTYAAMSPLIREVLQGVQVSAVGHGDYVDGRARTVHRDYVPIVKPDGRLDGFVMIVQDVTKRIQAEEERRRDAERIRQATEIAGLGYYVWDAVADRCTFCSEEHARLHGLTPEEYIARAAPMEQEFSLVHPEDRAFFKERMAALRSGEKVAFEYRVLLPDNMVRYVSEIIHPIFDESGRVVQEIGTSQDITQAKQAQEALEDSERRLKAGAKVAKLGHYVWDTLEDRCLYCSEEYARIHGMSVEDYFAANHTLQSDSQWVHPDDQERYWQAIETTTAERKLFRLEYRIVGADGVVRHVREIEHSMEIENGRIVRSEGTLQDISDIKRAEATLAESERRLKTAAQIAKLGHFVWDLVEDRCLYCSEELASIHGLSVKEYMERSLGQGDDAYAYLHPEDRDRYLNALDRTYDACEPVDIEYRIIRADGAVRHVHEIEHVFEVESGVPQRTEGIIQDITEAKQAQAFLAESERRLRTAAQMAKLGHFIWDLVEDRCIYCSEEMARMHGLTVEEYVDAKNSASADALRFVHPDDRQRYLEELRRTDEALEPLNIDYRMVAANGEIRHVHEIEHNIEVADGRFVRSEGTIQDITDIKQAQASLAESERRLKTAAQMAKLGHFVWDLVEDRCIYCSEELARIHGLTVEEYMERAIGVESEAGEFLHPDDRERYLEALRDGYEKLEPLSIEYRIIDVNGDVRHVREFEHSFIVENGIPQRSEGIVQDITDIRQAEQSLAESEQRLRTAAQIAKLGHFVWDLVEDKCTFFSEEAAQILGVSVEEYLERAAGVEADANSFVHPDDQEHYLEALNRTFEAQEPINVEYRIIRSDGEVRHLREVEHVFETKNGQPLRSEGIVQDITEIKQAEEQLRHAQKMEAIGQLTGGVAHDFNNLLTVVLGNLQLIERGVQDDEKLTKRIATAKHAAQRGAELTKSLLAFSRQQRLESEVLNLSEIVGGMRRLLRTTVSEHVELRLNLAQDLCHAAVDPAQLESALLNLVINARDAMPMGGCLVIETANAELEADSLAGVSDVTPGLYVMLSVTDNGTGMSPEVQKRVFDPFFTTKEVGKGTGLGLSMVFGFIKQSGGHIALYSEEGQGTCFRLFLPVAESASRPAEAAGNGKDCPTGCETILLVEDQDELRETSRAILEELGYRVLAAENGPSALSLLRHHSEIDLLFTDIVMPAGMNGLELADKAVAERPELKVLYTSGFSQAAVAGAGADRCQKNWIAKPFLNYTLAQKIREVLDRSYSA